MDQYTHDQLFCVTTKGSRTLVLLHKIFVTLWGHIHLPALWGLAGQFVALILKQ